MPLRRKLKVPSADADFILAGISCHLKDYRLVYNMNKKLGFDFKKLKDFVIYKQEDELKYSFYYYLDPDRQKEYFFVSNHHPESKLIKELKQTDYFLVIKGEADNKNIITMIGKIGKIPGVLAAFRADHKKIRDFPLFIQDLELQMIE